MTDKILIVDDDQSLCETIQMDLKRHGYGAVWTTSGEDAVALIEKDDFDCALVDMVLEDLNGIELCKRIVENRPDVPVIAITAFGSLEMAIAAIRAGVYDFMNKPIEFDLLRIHIDRALKHRSLKEQIKTLNKALERSRGFDTLLGSSPPMQRLYGQLARISETDMTVLITGESGTGKELVARAIHNHSRRASGPFIAISCPALPDTLLESELFGHVKGAFTDARATRRGILVQAHGGTVFLDEIGDMSLSLQPKLLRALETRAVRPLGGGEEVSFDARIIAATNCDLDSAVEEGSFREDLLFRINVVEIELAPLRDREKDPLVLAQFFVNLFADQMGKDVRGFTEVVAAKLLDYSWPGNVRELRNVMERAVALAQHDKIIVEDLPESIRNYRKKNFEIGGDSPNVLLSLAEVEQQYIQYVLEKTGGNKTLAARVLGLDRKTLYRKLRR
ncbi:MAG: sigma-54 dependent transcriptional regulator [Gammaproteobacteria bacterium]|jgi:DNA-binding NtrC family response regulator